MLEFEEALARVLADVTPLAAERVAVGDADGRILAEPLIAGEPMPAFDYSAMDGYAVASVDFAGEPPWTLPVRGESQTGHVAPPFARATACRIFTGAPLPDGADAVVMQENVERDGELARFAAAPRGGENVRHAGEDLARGALALEPGARLGPGQIALVASLDRADVLVARRPRVVVVCTGDELRAPGSAPRPGSIPESNGIAIAAMARRAGADARVAPLVGDDPGATRAAVAAALAEAELLVTIGGVSVGDHDVVRPALQAAGATLDFWKVRIRPGKPLASGRAGRARVLGLPGNPVSAQVTFALFGVPLLRAMQGATQRGGEPRIARLAAPLRQKPGRRGYYRARLEGAEVRPLTNQASGAVTSMAWADALIVVPADSEGYVAGELVPIIALGDL